MKETTRTKRIGLLVLLAALFWAAVPIIMLASDFRRGGITEVLKIIQVPEYDEIRMLAFYMPAIAFFVFCFLGLALLFKSNFSFNLILLTVLALAVTISMYTSLHGFIYGFFGLLVCVLVIWEIYQHKKNILNKSLNSTPKTGAN